jgi:methylaspartate mutase epsilon subunit
MDYEARIIPEDLFQKERREVLASWPTGKPGGMEIPLDEGIDYQKNLPREKQFAAILSDGSKEGKLLLQPRAGVALPEEHIALLRFLQEEADLLPTTIDAYTRQNRYEDAARGVERSISAGSSLLNGFPAVNHGVEVCRQVTEALDKPVQVRHGTPDARLLAEISLASGFSAFEGGGISYNIPYAKKIPLEQSIRHWKYVDRLCGIYGKAGAVINREPFGPLSGTLIPPFISHSVAILEGLLALEQGVRSVTLGYGQAGNLLQDVASIATLRELGEEYFTAAGFSGYELTTVFHQWMGGFPEDEDRAMGVISWGGIAAAMAGADKVITKTPHEAMGIPTREANLQGLKATRQAVNMLKGQQALNGPELEREKEMIRKEVRLTLGRALELGEGDPALAAVKGFEAGVIDVPFSPSVNNAGKLLPVRDNYGAVRIYQKGNIPFDRETEDFHREQIALRGRVEKRQPCFQMVIDDIYAISKGYLVGRPK